MAILFFKQNENLKKNYESHLNIGNTHADTFSAQHTEYRTRAHACACA